MSTYKQKIGYIIASLIGLAIMLYAQQEQVSEFTDLAVEHFAK